MKKESVKKEVEKKTGSGGKFKAPKGFPTGLELMKEPKKTEGDATTALGRKMFGNREIRVSLIKTKNAPKDGDFLPAAVYRNEEGRVWSYEDEKEEGFNGMAFIREVSTEVIILLQNKERRIVKVIPLLDLATQVKLEHAGKTRILGRRSAEALYDLKMAAHRKFGLSVELTEEDKKVKEARAAKEVAEILGRKGMTAFDAKAQPRSGIPVTTKELILLPLGSEIKVLRVKEYDKKAKKPVGDPLEHFVAIRGRGDKPKKRALFMGKLSWERPILKDDPNYGMLGLPDINIDGEVHKEVPWVDDNGLKKLLDSGLNDGTPVLHGQPNEKGEIQTYRLVCGEKGTEKHDIGFHKPLK